MAPGQKGKELRHLGRAVPLALAFVLAMGAVAMAAELNTSASLSTSTATRTVVQAGQSNSFTIKVWLEGNVNNVNFNGVASVVNKYTMAGNAPYGIVASGEAADRTVLDFSEGSGRHWTPGNTGGNGGFCPADTPANQGTGPMGCKTNPFTVAATLHVPVGVPDGTTGTVVVSTFGSTALDPDPSPAQGLIEVEVIPTVTNTAPVADAGGPYVGDEGEAVTINGSGSYDDDGDSLAYFWSAAPGSVGDVDAGATCVFDEATSAETTVSCSDDGTWDLTLTVIDGSGEANSSDDDTTTLKLGNVAPVKGTTGFTFNPYTGQASASVGFSDPGWTDVVTATWSGITGTGSSELGPRIDDGSDPLTGTFTAAQTYSGCVTNEISVQVADDDTGSFSHEFAAANTLGTYSVAWMAPIKDGARNIVSQKNVLPLKITIVDSCTGQLVTDRTLQVRLQSGIQDPGDVTEGTSVASESVSSADSGNVMRLSDGHYQYNQTTKNLQLNLPYTIVIKDVTGGLTWAQGQTVTTAVIEAKK